MGEGKRSGRIVGRVGRLAAGVLTLGEHRQGTGTRMIKIKEPLKLPV